MCPLCTFPPAPIIHSMHFQSAAFVLISDNPHIVSTNKLNFNHPLSRLNQAAMADFPLRGRLLFLFCVYSCQYGIFPFLSFFKIFVLFLSDPSAGIWIRNLPCIHYLGGRVSSPPSPGIPSSQANYQSSDDTHKTLTGSVLCWNCIDPLAIHAKARQQGKYFNILCAQYVLR